MPSSEATVLVYSDYSIMVPHINSTQTLTSLRDPEASTLASKNLVLSGIAEDLSSSTSSETTGTRDWGTGLERITSGFKRGVSLVLFGEPNRVPEKEWIHHPEIQCLQCLGDTIPENGEKGPVPLHARL